MGRLTQMNLLIPPTCKRNFKWRLSRILLIQEIAMELYKRGQGKNQNEAEALKLLYLPI